MDSLTQNIKNKVDTSSIFFVPVVIFLAIAAIFVLRLLYLQVLVAGEYSANASEVRTIRFDVTPHRGTIYDRNGIVLAVSVDSKTIYCNPSEVTNVDYEARKLAEILGGEKEDYEAKLTSDTSTFAYIKRQADIDVADRVKQEGLDGIYFIEESRREYPNGHVGGQVIGACDVDGNGICGLELQYDDILKGTPGTYSGERGERGTPIPGGVHEDVKAVDGEDIMISLDITLQEAVERCLENGLRGEKNKKQGSALLMDSETGDIFAACSYPFLDPSDLASSYVGSDNLTPVTMSIEPGSVFKAFTALSVLEENALAPTDELFVPSSLDADEYTITDAHERDDVTMSFSEILDKSSNVGISLALDKVGFKKLHGILRSLKFSEATDIDFPGEASGSLADVSQWSKVGGYNIGFGQGMTATPLQIVRAYGAIANEGIMVKPHFLISKPLSDEWMSYDNEKVLEDQSAIDKLVGMLRGVVIDGTGKDANIDGFEVVGKTSTAQIAESGGYAEERWNLCFTGFINNSNSPLVCFVGANDVDYEGNVSPIFHDIMIEAIDLCKIVPE